MPSSNESDPDLQSIRAEPNAHEGVEVEWGNEADISPPRGHVFPIVGVGSSAGGLDAVIRLLKALPENTGMAFVLVQHLDPSRESQLPDILSGATGMPIHTVEDGMAVRPNEVFVIPPNSTMLLEDGVLRLAERHPGLHLPIDAFFESLARVQGARAIGVVLSGNASDGSQGVKAIKQECGLTFAQDEATAQHVSMPRNAIATGAVDYVLSPAEIAGELVRLSRHPFVRLPGTTRSEDEVLPEGNGDLKKIFNLLRSGTKVDFHHYKRNTIRRRIGRRMIIKHAHGLAEYARLLEEHPDEVKELYRDLLISVTNFFRDPPVFIALAGLLKGLLPARNLTEPFRVWVPGCASGEEVYSIAICLKELLDDLQLSTPLQFFGTDINEIALDRARAATYPDLIAQDVSPERLRRFFVRTDRGFQICKSIRETCVFARHDITNDPPFGRTDLISCRNLLIYFDSTLQRRMIPVFHYSLNADGLLLLGNVESISAENDLFTTADKQHHIYKRKAVPSRLFLQSPSQDRRREAFSSLKSPLTLGGIDLQKKVDLIIQSKYAPAAVVVNSDMEILGFRGHTGFYLEPTPGEPNLNLLRMIREKLTAPLRKALESSASQNVSIRENGIPVQHHGERRDVSLEITPISGSSPGERYFLVVFEGTPSAQLGVEPAVASEPPQETPLLTARIRDLQQQLAEAREYLRNANEDHEASSEELRAANEEIRSANEELQSTNEELSTTKEELQSANEELTTLNEELQNRNQSLDALNNDLLNLLNAVDISFVMLDNELRLRRFSAAAENTLKVGALDIGHALTHIDGPFDMKAFQEPMRRVIETLRVESWELQDKTGHWYSVTIRPYRTIDNRISGTVVVFLDIDPLKRTLRAVEEARDYAEGMIETVREPLLVLNGDLRIMRATPSFYDTFQVSRAETEGRLLYDLGNGQWNVPRLRELIGDALYRNQPFQDFEVEHLFPHIGRRVMRLNARRISRENDDRRSVLLAIEDVTQQQEAAEVRYRRLFESAKDGILIFDAETEKLTDVNPSFLELTGYGRERLIGYRLSEMQAFQASGAAINTVSDTRSRSLVRHEGVPLRTNDGKNLETDIVANGYPVGGQNVVQLHLRDVTARNKAVQALRQSESTLRLLVDSVRDYALFQMDLGGRITSWNTGAQRLLGYSESEILGQPGSRVFTPEDVENGMADRELQTARINGSAVDERWHISKDGSRFFASGVLTTVKDDYGRLRGFAKVMRDITDRKRAEEQLKQQAQLLELAQDIIIVRKLDGTLSFWNNSASLAYGWSREEALGKVAHDLLNAIFPQPPAEIHSVLLREGHWEGEVIHKRRDGSQLTVWSRWALQLDTDARPVSILEISSDITARKLADQQIRSSLREKEVLLKEIHHRVKNNLQVISSLLSLQSEHSADSKILGILNDMKTRVRSIATIHEILYDSADLSRINFAGYLNSIATDLKSFYVSDSDRLNLIVESEAVVLDITQAVPCGLIVNELLTNSFRYAFPEDRTGTIRVDFRCTDEKCKLEISDNGISLPKEVEPHNAVSMGFQLVTLLVQQIKGKLTIDREAGTRFVVEFMRKPFRTSAGSTSLF